MASYFDILLGRNKLASRNLRAYVSRITLPKAHLDPIGASVSKAQYLSIDDEDNETDGVEGEGRIPHASKGKGRATGGEEDPIDADGYDSDVTVVN